MSSRTFPEDRRRPARRDSRLPGRRRARAGLRPPATATTRTRRAPSPAGGSRLAFLLRYLRYGRRGHGPQRLLVKAPDPGAQGCVPAIPTTGACFIAGVTFSAPSSNFKIEAVRPFAGGPVRWMCITQTGTLSSGSRAARPPPPRSAGSRTTSAPGARSASRRWTTCCGSRSLLRPWRAVPRSAARSRGRREEAVGPPVRHPRAAARPAPVRAAARRRALLAELLGPAAGAWRVLRASTAASRPSPSASC